MFGTFETVKRVCDLTGKKRNNGFSISFSHKRNKKIQYPNLQKRKVYWARGQRWVKMKISTKVCRSGPESSELFHFWCHDMSISIIRDGLGCEDDFLGSSAKKLGDKMKKFSIFAHALYVYMDFQALRTIEKVGLEKMAKEAGIDLWNLPFKDERPQRKAYLLEHPMEVG